MKVIVKSNIVYTTDQIHKKVLTPGEHEVSKFVYELLKNGKNIELVKDEEKHEEKHEEKVVTPVVDLEKNILDSKIENNDSAIIVENNDLEKNIENDNKTTQIESSYSRKGRIKK